MFTHLSLPTQTILSMRVLHDKFFSTMYMRIIDLVHWRNMFDFLGHFAWYPNGHCLSHV
jgi:hypothetical protein